jgi:hypothetical protein
MSEISRLAKAFEQRANEQAESTEKAVESAFEKHESALLSALSESERTTSAAIRGQSRRLKRVALQSWIAVAIPVMLTLLLGAGALGAMSWHISNQIDEIAHHRSTLETLKAKGSAIKMTTCGEDGRLCVEVAEPDKAGYGENGQYRVLKGY